MQDFVHSIGSILFFNWKRVTYEFRIDTKRKRKSTYLNVILNSTRSRLNKNLNIFFHIFPFLSFYGICTFIILVNTRI